MSRYKAVNVNGRTVLEHRFLWEKANGPIPKGCVLHHINGDPRDNRLENLLLMTVKEHTALHREMREEGVDVVDISDPKVHEDRIKRGDPKERIAALEQIVEKEKLVIERRQENG